MGNTKKIIDNKLCLGCGLCEALSGKDNVKMQLDKNGFFLPVGNILSKEESIIYKICPGINIDNDISFDKNESVWGRILDSFSAHSSDNEIRKKGSSGGVISSIAIYLLENKIIDSVLQIGGNPNDFQENTLKISNYKEDVLNCAASRYAPALVFNNILDILNKDENKYCFIGKPCDISGLKNLLKHYPQYNNRFVFFISIVCAGMPSFIATEDAIDHFQTVKYPVKDLTYRGNGWPGYFSFLDSNNKKYQMSYNDSWGNILGKKIHFRCKICPDGIGLQADFVAGDAWETKNGYPDFSEKEGESLVITRTKQALDLFSKMIDEDKVRARKLDPERIKQMQPFQYNRRSYVAPRIIALLLIKRIFPSFRNTKIWHNLFNSSLKRSIREFIGTTRRLIIQNKN